MAPTPAARPRGSRGTRTHACHLPQREVEATRLGDGALALRWPAGGLRARALVEAAKVVGSEGDGDADADAATTAAGGSLGGRGDGGVLRGTARPRDARKGAAGAAACKRMSA
eukprot:2760077-Prymnesium_polylepis.1